MVAFSPFNLSRGSSLGREIVQVPDLSELQIDGDKITLLKDSVRGREVGPYAFDAQRSIGNMGADISLSTPQDHLKSPSFLSFHLW